MLVTSIFSISNNVFNAIKDKIIILDNFILSSANAFNLVQSRILSFGKELIDSISRITGFYVPCYPNRQIHFRSCYTKARRNKEWKLNCEKKQNAKTHDIQQTTFSHRSIRGFSSCFLIIYNDSKQNLHGYMSKTITGS